MWQAIIWTNDDYRLLMHICVTRPQAERTFVGCHCHLRTCVHASSRDRSASRAGTSNYIPQYLWDVITCPCPKYLLQVHKSKLFRYRTWNHWEYRVIGTPLDAIVLSSTVDQHFPRHPYKPRPYPSVDHGLTFCRRGYDTIFWKVNRSRMNISFTKSWPCRTISNILNSWFQYF